MTSTILCDAEVSGRSRAKGRANTAIAPSSALCRAPAASASFSGLEPAPRDWSNSLLLPQPALPSLVSLPAEGGGRRSLGSGAQFTQLEPRQRRDSQPARESWPWEETEERLLHVKEVCKLPWLPSLSGPSRGHASVPAYYCAAAVAAACVCVRLVVGFP